MNPTRPPTGDRPDDDAHWFDLLAGRPADDGAAGTRAEAALLRAALLRHRPQAPRGQPAAADARITRLLDRARAEGVLAAAPPPLLAAAPRSAWRPPAWAWLGGLAAGVLLVVIGLQLQRQDTPPESVLRGAAVQQWPVADPLQRRQQLQQALQAAGFDAQPFDRLGRAGLDIALPVPLPAAQARALAALGITPPAGPSLQIELLPLAPAPATAPASR